MLVVGLVLLSAPAIATAQQDAGVSEKRAPLLWDVTRRVALDPTTYATPVVVYTARQLDWKTSQPLFRSGYLEANPDFTFSGRPNDVPIGYAAGNKKILQESLGLFNRTVANNAASAVLEHVLITRAPRHRKLIRTLGWIERVSFASYWSYRLSERQFRQWRANERLARQVGAR